MQWVDANQAAGCSHSLLACHTQGQQNNWLITQYINISNTAVTDINVNATFVTSVKDCVSGCAQTVPIRIYQTNTVDEEGRMNTTGNYGAPVARLIHTTGGGQHQESDNKVIPITLGTTGLYLALTDEGTCVEVSRLVVSYTVCPAQMVNLVSYPETAAPTINNVRDKMVAGSCVDPASHVRGSLTLECNFGGLWGSNVDAVCQCDPGYQFINGSNPSCEGVVDTLR